MVWPFKGGILFFLRLIWNKLLLVLIASSKFKAPVIPIKFDSKLSAIKFSVFVFEIYYAIS